jgi:hypothetical protein
MQTCGPTNCNSGARKDGEFLRENIGPQFLPSASSQKTHGNIARFRSDWSVAHFPTPSVDASKQTMRVSVEIKPNSLFNSEKNPSEALPSETLRALRWTGWCIE